MLKEFFVRDPDPLWRWASGQAVRRMSRHPTFRAGLLFVVWALLSTGSFVLARIGDPNDLESARAAVLSVAALFGVLTLFLLQMRSVMAPIDAFGAMGGPALARELQLTAIPRGQLARLYFWGLFRNFAVLYSIAYLPVVIAGTCIFVSLEPPDRWLMYFLLAFVLKPPVDYFCNFAMGWNFYFRTGSKAQARLYNGLTCLFVFPALGLAAFVLAAYLTERLSLDLYFDEIVPIFLGIAFAVKVRIGLRCYRSFVTNFETRLGDKFFESA